MESAVDWETCPRTDDVLDETFGRSSSVCDSLSGMDDLVADAVPMTPDNVNPPAAAAKYGSSPVVIPETSAGQHQCGQPVVDVHKNGASKLGAVPVGTEGKEVTVPTYDGVIIHHENNKDSARTLKDRLNKLVLDDGTCAVVAIESDDPTLGKTEVAYFESWLDKAHMMYFYASKDFCDDHMCVNKSDVGLFEQFFYEFGKKEFVVPIFLDNKRTARYLKPSLRAIRGVDYINEQWNERVESSFKANLNQARNRNKQSTGTLESKMNDLRLGDH